MRQIDLELARKFLLDWHPPVGQATLNDVFNVLREHPLLILNNGIVTTHLQYIKDAPAQLAVCASTGLVTGFALAYCMQNTEVQDGMKAWLDDAAKARGGNVVNFLHHKKEISRG